MVWTINQIALFCVDVITYKSFHLRYSILIKWDPGAYPKTSVLNYSDNLSKHTRTMRYKFQDTHCTTSVEYQSIVVSQSFNQQIKSIPAGLYSFSQQSES